MVNRRGDYKVKAEKSKSTLLKHTNSISWSSNDTNKPCQLQSSNDRKHELFIKKMKATKQLITTMHLKSYQGEQRRQAVVRNYRSHVGDEEVSKGKMLSEKSMLTSTGNSVIPVSSDLSMVALKRRDGHKLEMHCLVGGVGEEQVLPQRSHLKDNNQGQVSPESSEVRLHALTENLVPNGSNELPKVAEVSYNDVEPDSEEECSHADGGQQDQIALEKGHCATHLTKSRLGIRNVMHETVEAGSNHAIKPHCASVDLSKVNVLSGKRLTTYRAQAGQKDPSIMKCQRKTAVDYDDYEDQQTDLQKNVRTDNFVSKNNCLLTNEGQYDFNVWNEYQKMLAKQDICHECDQQHSSADICRVNI